MPFIGYGNGFSLLAWFDITAYFTHINMPHISYALTTAISMEHFIMPSYTAYVATIHFEAATTGCAHHFSSVLFLAPHNISPIAALIDIRHADAERSSDDITFAPLPFTEKIRRPDTILLSQVNMPYYR